MDEEEDIRITNISADQWRDVAEDKDEDRSKIQALS